MVNERYIKVFRAVMNAQTTVGASRALGVSQPAVSHALGRLESDLGFPLFNRVGNRLIPRDEAKTLYSASESLFLYSQALEQTIEDIRENRLGHVRVAATPQLGHSMLPDAIGRFMATRPEVKVFYDVLDSYRMIESVGTLAADFGLATALEPELSEAFSMVKLASVDMVCVVAPDHPLAQRRWVKPADMARYPLIGLSPASARLGSLIAKVFREANVRYRIAVEVHYAETACMLVAAGAGIAIVDAFSAITPARDKKLVAIPFRPRLSVDVWALCAKDRPLSRLAQVLLDETRVAIHKFLSDVPFGSVAKSR
jgi:DNA-binding transcriptional LysR family regulator